MRVSPFWRSGLTFSILLLAILPAFDFYISRQMHSEVIAGTYQELEALAQVARARWLDVPDMERCARPRGVAFANGGQRRGGVDPR